ncbi:MAG: NAD(P)/FAD-dependent oxidoreductase, partial [Acidobacteriota bacterium]
RDGLSVLMVEQHYMVGGYCSTFRRAGYTFDASTHFYPLLGNPETMTGKLLGELGVTTRWRKMDPVDTFHFPDGERFDVDADLATYRRHLDERFPEQREALDDFFREVRTVHLLGLLAYFRDHPTPRLDAWRDQTLAEALERHFDDRRLKLLLAADCAHWGSAPSQTSFVFDSMLRLSYFDGNYYPEGGSQAFADELARCFEERGGDILMSTRARRILVEDETACGVELEILRGRNRRVLRVAADAVISNADLTATVAELLPADRVDPGYRQQIESMQPSFPCFLSHIGLRDVPDDVLERAQGYYWNAWDADRVGRNGLRCKVFAPTLYEPRMAPDGGQIVILQKVLDLDDPEMAAWASDKARVERYVTDALDAAIPGIRDQIVVQTSASADTARRFTLNRGGAMLGWTMAPGQLGEQRPSIEGPIRGLWLVGHWVRPGGGITPVIVSAMRVAAAILGATEPRRSQSPASAVAEPPA